MNEELLRRCMAEQFDLHCFDIEGSINWYIDDCTIDNYIEAVIKQYNNEQK